MLNLTWHRKGKSCVWIYLVEFWCNYIIIKCSIWNIIWSYVHTWPTSSLFTAKICVIFLRRKCFCRVQILGAALDIPQLEPVERKWHSVWHPPSPLEFNSSLQPIFNFLLHIKVSTLKLFHEWETKRKLLSDALMVMVFSFHWQAPLFQSFYRSYFVFTA